MWLGGGVFDTAAATWPDARPLTRLGFETIELRRTEQHHLFVSGRANGRRVSCLVDTGWSFTTVQPGKGVTAAAIAALRLGRVTFTNQPARVEAIQFNRQPASFDLVLGLDFLRQHSAVLDCGRRRLFTRPASHADEATSDLATVLGQAGFRELPMRLKAPPALTVTAVVNGERVELLVDSGAVWSCLDQRQVARLGLQPQNSTTRITGAGATGIRPVAVANVKSLQLGDVELKGTMLALLDLADWGFAAPEQTLGEVQGILGGDLLAALNAAIDCQRLKLWIKPRTRR